MRWTSMWRVARVSALLLCAVMLSISGAAPWWGASVPAAVQPIKFHPTWTTWDDIELVSLGETPPTQAQCKAINRRCFSPQAEQASYNLTPLLKAGHQGQGQTIIIVDSFGSETIRHDLMVFNNAFGLPHMCGEEGTPANCTGPTFSELQQGNTSTNPQPSQSHGTRLQDRSAWAIEVSLDVEWAHSMAPLANILLVTTPVAEETLNGGIHENLRSAFKAAQANRVTVFASSGDGGSANNMKTPVRNFNTIPFPFPTVEWPASDPLVTGVGGTYECTDPVTGVGVNDTAPPGTCAAFPGQREVGWIGSGGGFSHVFARPTFQDTLPAGSTPIPTAQRGVPDISIQASSRTGVLIFITNPGYSTNVNDTGWYVIGGTSSGSPQWSGLIAVANEMNGGKQLGYINTALYALASVPATYAKDFYDVTTGNNQADPSIPGFPATTGWDPVTGLGTPNAAELLPDLISYVNTH